jgi:hypothetical protein
MIVFAKSLQRGRDRLLSRGFGGDGLCGVADPAKEQERDARDGQEALE